MTELTAMTGLTAMPAATAMSGARCPVVQFDHNSSEHAADPAGSYRALRRQHPVAWSDANGGYWIISGYQALFDAARDDEVFSSARSADGGEGLTVVIPKTPMHLHIPIELDPPDFRKYRKIVNAITAPAAISGMTDMIEFYCTWFVDRVIERGECDFTEIIGVPSIVTIDWLGLPLEDWSRFAAAHQAVLAQPRDSAEFQHTVAVDLPYLAGRMRDTIARRRAEPRDDVISYLCAQEIDGWPITEDEVFSIVDLLVAGGTVTTANLVSQSLIWLYQHPDVRRRLIDEPELLERAVEEFLRYFAPSQALARTVVQDVEFHGCPLKAGDRALLAWASANRDEAGGFEDPDEIDIERWPNRHTSFGVGIHRCAGSHLGRAMGQRLLTEVLTRMPDYEIDLDGLVPYAAQGANAGYTRVPARFTPGPRILPDGDLTDRAVPRRSRPRPS
jgi:cytochrome P450